jgi:hypothetical protein
MTSSRLLDWIVALMVCWASLTAILQPPNDSARCDAPHTTGRASGVLHAPPTPAQIDAAIRDMKLHD